MDSGRKLIDCKDGEFFHHQQYALDLATTFPYQITHRFFALDNVFNFVCLSDNRVAIALANPDNRTSRIQIWDDTLSHLLKEKTFNYPKCRVRSIANNQLISEIWDSEIFMILDSATLDVVEEVHHVLMCDAFMLDAERVAFHSRSQKLSTYHLRTKEIKHNVISAKDVLKNNSLQHCNNDLMDANQCLKYNRFDFSVLLRDGRTLLQSHPRSASLGHDCINIVDLPTKTRFTFWLKDACNVRGLNTLANGQVIGIVIPVRSDRGKIFILEFEHIRLMLQARDNRNALDVIHKILITNWIALYSSLFSRQQHAREDLSSLERAIIFARDNPNDFFLEREMGLYTTLGDLWDLKNLDPKKIKRVNPEHMEHVAKYVRQNSVDVIPIIADYLLPGEPSAKESKKVSPSKNPVTLFHHRQSKSGAVPDEKTVSHFRGCLGFFSHLAAIFHGQPKKSERPKFVI